MSSEGKLRLIDVSDFQQVVVRSEGLDVFFPDGILWGDVLDCRIPPYAAQSVEDNCNFAHHVHKTFVLMKAED